MQAFFFIEMSVHFSFVWMGTIYFTAGVAIGGNIIMVLLSVGKDMLIFCEHKLYITLISLSAEICGGVFITDIVYSFSSNYVTSMSHLTVFE